MGKLDLTGQRFGKLTVIEEIEPKIMPSGDKRIQWLCRCDCGNEINVTTFNLRRGHVKSCGCYKHEWAKENVTTHGQTGSRLYRIWSHMKRRCNNPKAKEYHRYGGRGITVCDEWNRPDGFEAFYNWAINNGYQEDLTIDRINNNGNYCPENCRWATSEEQMNNVNYNVHITHNGITHTIAEWAKILGLNQDTIQARKKYYGLSDYEALFKTPTCEKRVEIFKDGISLGIFDSQKKAAEFIGCKTSTMSKAIKENTKIKKTYVVKRLPPEYIEYSEGA